MRFLNVRSVKTLLGCSGLICVAFAAQAWAGVIEDVRGSLAQNNFSAAEAVLNSYKTQHGVTPEYVEAYSWMARGALSQKQYDQAIGYAKQTKDLVQQEVKQYPLDSEPDLPIALGAALEVHAQALAAQGQAQQATILLQTAIRVYGTTSIRARLQKNLNLLSFQGKVAPTLKEDDSLGAKLPADLKGSPMLLFFWAHWCSDCKYEIPILARIKAEFAPKGLVLIAPTQKYGYVAGGDDAPPEVELRYIEQVRQKFYGSIIDTPAPVSEENFNKYGASTTPTFVLIDRNGIVKMYHPGGLTYEELRPRVEALFR